MGFQLPAQGPGTAAAKGLGVEGSITLEAARAHPSFSQPAETLLAIRAQQVRLYLCGLIHRHV